MIAILFNRSLRDYIIIIPAVLIALMFHEVAHGLVAYWMGDDTAKKAGRLTLNPLDHLDPIGTLCMVIFGFGWAKPVPVNPFRFKHHKAGMTVTALAGPIANFLLSFVLLLFYGIFMTIAPDNRILAAVAEFFFRTATLSIGLGVFNLIPIPPLDGSRVLQALLPNKLYYKFFNYQAYFQIGLMVLLFFGALDGVIFRLQSGMMVAMFRGVSSLLGLFGI